MRLLVAEDHPSLARSIANGLRDEGDAVDLTFGLDTAPWDPERTLERYELLWEAGLVAEASRERDPEGPIIAVRRIGT